MSSKDAAAASSAATAATAGAGGGGEDWCTIESDPGVFTELLETIGCKCVELDELYSIDDNSLAQLKEFAGHKVYGLIFLFKWLAPVEPALKETAGGGGDGESKEDGGGDSDETTKWGEPLTEDQIPANLFFAHQVTTNACATQAILSVVLNAGLSPEELGSTLAEFQSFTSTFPPALKGVAISSSDEIRTAHNAFARQDAFLADEKFHLPTDNDEAFHFVAYVPNSGDGHVYELDGLQKGPVVVGSYDAKDDAMSWLGTARTAIQHRMRQGGDHIKFNLMAVIQDKRVALKAALLQADTVAASLTAETEEHYGDYAGDRVAALTAEEAKREQWKVENQRRRHNYVRDYCCVVVCLCVCVSL